MPERLGLSFSVGLKEGLRSKEIKVSDLLLCLEHEHLLQTPDPAPFAAAMTYGDKPLRLVAKPGKWYMHVTCTCKKGARKKGRLQHKRTPLHIHVLHFGDSFELLLVCSFFLPRGSSSFDSRQPVE